MTTKELFKERMSIRKTDPVRASVLGMLIDTVQKTIRELDREETPADIAAAAKKMYSQDEATIAEYQKGGGDIEQIKAEMKVLEPFLPATLSAEQMEAEVKKIIDSLGEGERNLKNIMPRLKAVEGMDMKIAKGLVEKLL